MPTAIQRERLSGSGRKLLDIGLVHDGFHTSDEVEITVSLPPVIRVCHKGVEEAVDKMGLNGHLAHGDAIGACAAF